ncbi:MAG: hypothetical protein ABR541_05770 [Candidatus Dormibacteria bacterium]
MPLSPRLVLVAAVLAVLASTLIVHVLPRSAPLAGPPLFAPTAPPPSPAPLVLPSPRLGTGSSSWLPPALRSPGGLWTLLNRDTAATTRGQLSIVRSLARTLRDQLRSLLEHPPIGAG